MRCNKLPNAATPLVLELTEQLAMVAPRQRKQLWDLRQFDQFPAVESGSIQRALVLGGLFGFFAYATYDLTSLATTRGFPLRLALVDMAWGAALTAAAAAIGAAVTLQAA